jgi:hypothetical protein
LNIYIFHKFKLINSICVLSLYQYEWTLYYGSIIFDLKFSRPYFLNIFSFLFQNNLWPFPKLHGNFYCTCYINHFQNGYFLSSLIILKKISMSFSQLTSKFKKILHFKKMSLVKLTFSYMFQEIWKYGEESCIFHKPLVRTKTIPYN